MNKNIEQLWTKAAQYASAYPSGQNNSWETQVEFLNKFAQLVALECAKIADSHLSGPGCVIRDNIKKHFGVEE